MASQESLWTPLTCFAVFIWSFSLIIADMQIGDGAMNFYEASSYCAGLGRQLLSIDSEAIQQEAVALCKSKTYGVGSCWIGLHQPNSGDWEWTDGSDTDFGFYGGPTTSIYPWNLGQPDNFWSGEDCVQLCWWMSYNWNDCACTESHYPICGMHCLTYLQTSIIHRKYDCSLNVWFANCFR